MGTERPIKNSPGCFLFSELQHMSVCVLCVCVCVCVCKMSQRKALHKNDQIQGGESRDLGVGADFWRLTRLLTFRGGLSHRNYKQDVAEK